MSLVSVVMPTHNAARWVVDTLDNLSAQTYPHLELIVVDDGSHDKTVEIVRNKLAADFKHAWQVIELGDNRGPSAARNIGLKAATGSWVQFLDSDDFMDPSKFERQMAYCLRASSDVSAIYSSWRRCYIDDGVVSWAGPLVQPSMLGRAPLMCLVGNDRPLHSAGLARRSALERIGGFDESLRFWECEEVTVRLAKAGRLEAVPSSQPLYLWREHRDKVYIGGAGARYQTAPVALSWIEQMLKAAEHQSFDELGLSAADRRDILQQSTEWARQLYCENIQAFRSYIAMAQMLDRRIAPAHPKYASALSGLIGYELAEGVARLARAPGTVARKLRSKLQPAV